MELHAEYFLKCPEAAKWLNTPQPVTGVPKEFLDGAYAITNTIAGLCERPSKSGSVPTPKASSSTSLRCCEGKVAPSPLRASSRGSARKSSSKPCSSARPPPSSRAVPSASSRPKSCVNPCSSISYASSLDRSFARLERPFPDLDALGSGRAFCTKSLLYVPVELHEHFVFGVVLGCVMPPPEGVASSEWKPLVNRFVLDLGRKCCLMFSYFAEGSIVVSVDCFDELGDHFSEVTFFEPTPVVGVFPRGIRGRMQIFEKRDCPSCPTACMSCACSRNDRINAIVKMRNERVIAPEHGPAHAGSSYKDENVTIQTYPYWAQSLDEYKWSRVGSYCVQVRYTEYAARLGPERKPTCRSLAFKASFDADGRATVDQMLRVGLFDKGVSALKPPVTDVRWESSSTVSVNEKNQVRHQVDPVNAVCFTDWHKLPGLQEDYLLVAPSNIVSGAHARAELARAEAARLEARERSGVPILPSWASGRVGVFEHIMIESGRELEVLRGAYSGGLGDDLVEPNQGICTQILGSYSQDSVGTVMGPRVSIEKKSSSGTASSRSSGDSRRRHSHEVPRNRIVEGLRRSSVDSAVLGRDVETVVESNRKRRTVIDETNG